MCALQLSDPPRRSAATCPRLTWLSKNGHGCIRMSPARQGRSGLRLEPQREAIAPVCATEG
jgi:hypothetical protein